MVHQYKLLSFLALVQIVYSQIGLMNCRSSDYRTLAGDPEFDVVGVQADVGELGYHMLMMVTTVPKQPKDYSQITSLYVLGGWDCAVRAEFEIKDVKVAQARIYESPNCDYLDPDIYWDITCVYTLTGLYEVHILMEV